MPTHIGSYSNLQSSEILRNVPTSGYCCSTFVGILTQVDYPYQHFTPAPSPVFSYLRTVIDVVPAAFATLRIREGRKSTHKTSQPQSTSLSEDNQSYAVSIPLSSNPSDFEVEKPRLSQLHFQLRENEVTKLPTRPERENIPEVFAAFSDRVKEIHRSYLSSQLYYEMWSKCLQLLKDGNWAEGWPDHEWIRTGDPQFKDRFEPTPTYGKPIWRGEKEPIKLLVNADFGMGDTIHFYRFLAETVQRVQKVYLKCDEDFKNLFDVEIAQAPEFDKICHMMTLPKVLLAEISGKPYLTPKGQPHELLAKLQFDKPKVGFCWAGNPFNPKDSDRSIPLDILQEMIAGVTPYTLVKHCEAPEGFLDVRGLMGDWNQTAHLLKSLDLIVSVDTAIAHLGGALGVPTWLLLPDDPDWRWGKESKSTVWYDSVQILRRSKCWTSLIEPVRQKLLSLKLS